MRTTALVLASLVTLSASISAQPRQTLDLGGEWEFVKVKDLADGPPAAGWAKRTIPGVLSGVDYERAWFRREFTIPATMQGSRVTVHFGGVKWNSVVRVNGQRVGGHYGGYEPFDVDITAVARVGETNRLELGCHDWTGVFIDRETDFSTLKQRPADPRDLPRDKILSPVGGRVSDYGPWDRITLQSHPAIYVRDLFIKPSVRQKKLTAEYVLANETAAATTVSLTAAAEGYTGLGPPRQIGVPAGGEAKATVEAAWTDPHLWSPEDPFRYDLMTALYQDGKRVDELHTRFGFREFWVEGPHFYLNGSRINLLATSWWPEIGVTADYVRQRLQAIKRANCVVFRTHTQPWPEVWYEVADEVGLLMIPEGPVWNDRETYRINDPKFWDNYATALKAMVDRDKNKPSVVMYSLENEFYGGRLKQGTPAAQELARMGQLMKQWDPTRPIYYESDGDPGGVADAVGLHYPHEYPDYAQWPNTAYWMDQPLLNKFLAPTDEAAKSWVWDRTKPVYIGEFLWIPSSDPSWDTVFYGDEAYLDYHRYHVQAKADSWRMAIQAYRHYEVGGISPWTMVEGGALDDNNAMYVAQQYAMQHVAAYVREYDHSFHSGEKVTRTADVYNDMLEPSKLTVQWALVDEGSRSVTAPTTTAPMVTAPTTTSPTIKSVGAVIDRARGETTRDMQPGERQEITFTVPLPQVTERRQVALRLRIEREGKVVFEDTKPWSVLPPLRLQATVPVGLYDPAVEVASKLQQAGLTTVSVTDLGHVPPQVKVLIVAPGALQRAEPRAPRIGEKREGSGRLLDYVRGGGRVLVLEQKDYPPGVMPAALSEHASTMTFPQVPNHPLLRGVRPDDLKWWRPDNLVSVAEIVRPTQGGARAVVVSGSRAGLSRAPLLELTLRRGTLVMSQLRIGERLGVEPAAGIILQNALDYLTYVNPSTVATALYCQDQQTREALQGLGLQATDITAAPSQADWPAIALLVACHPIAGLEVCLPQLQALLQRGGTILLHGLEPSELHELRSLLPTEVKLATYHGAVTRLPGAGPLSDFLANEDLYWLGRSTAVHSWATRPRATDMTSAVVSRGSVGKTATEYSHTAMTVAGAYAADRPEGAVLPSGGSTATAHVDIPTDGAYVLGVVAGGSIAAGEWPAGSVLVDGQTVGEFACQKGEFDTYALPADLKAGKHEVTIRFTNDMYDEANKQDRNLLVKALLVAPDDRAREVTFVTSPAALAVVKAGPGRVVLDCINWDKTQSNTEKAGRYIAGLLTGLGAPFEPAGVGTVLDLNSFTPQPDLPWFRHEGGGLYMGAAGYVRGDIECARSGQYVMRVTARGTPAAGQFPIAAVEMDGQEVGKIELKSDGWRTYRLPIKLTEGKHELKLTFTNDIYQPPEDTNLWIGRVEVGEGE